MTKTTSFGLGPTKKKSGKVGVSYSEAVDEALCFGWIDGLKKAADNVSQARKNKRCLKNLPAAGTSERAVGRICAVPTVSVP